MNTPRERNINFITAEDKAHAIESADENTKSFLMDMLSQFSMLSEQGNVIIMKGILLGFETCSQVSYGQDLPDWAARSIYLMRRLVLNLERPSGETGVTQLGAKVQRSIPKGANAKRD